MNLNKLSLFVMIIMAMMFSCTNDNELPSSKSEYVNSVRVTVEDFQTESTSRAAYTVDGSGFHFQWADGDALGIYPVGGDQVKFPISNGDGSASAEFDGGAWKLRSEYQYAAYYPFSASNYTISEKSLPVSYTGQAQNGDGSTAHLGAYDYLACAPSTPDRSGGVDLTMKHLGAFVRLQLTMPKADTYSSVVLESDGAKFVTAGTFDLTTATPAITPTATSPTYTINLSNIATTEKDQVITIYTIVAPANLSTSNIKVSVHGTGQTTYVQTIPGKNFVARSAYNIAVDNFPSGTNASGEDVSWEDTQASNMENGHEFVDLGLPSGLKWATCNIGAATPEEYGDYFAWGATATQQVYNWFNTPYQTQNTTDNSSTRFTKYLNSNTDWYKDGKAIDDAAVRTVLNKEDDAAHVNWGGEWRMPTRAEQDELRENCYWEWATSYKGRPVIGCIVYKVKNNKDKGIESNSGTPVASYSELDQHIFIPSAGYYSDNKLYSAGEDGGYWSSSLSTSYSNYAYYLSVSFRLKKVNWNGIYRKNGYPIRAVCP